MCGFRHLIQVRSCCGLARAGDSWPYRASRTPNSLSRNISSRFPLGYPTPLRILLRRVNSSSDMGDFCAISLAASSAALEVAATNLFLSPHVKVVRRLTSKHGRKYEVMQSLFESLGTRIASRVSALEHPCITAAQVASPHKIVPFVVIWGKRTTLVALYCKTGSNIALARLTLSAITDASQGDGLLMSFLGHCSLSDRRHFSRNERMRHANVRLRIFGC